jgi:hypothetical protein
MAEETPMIAVGVDGNVALTVEDIERQSWPRYYVRQGTLVQSAQADASGSCSRAAP